MSPTTSEKDMKLRKRNILLTVLVIIIGLSIWTYTRWDAWFDNPPEPPYTAAKTPSRVLLTFGNDGELSRFVSWMCDDKVDTEAMLFLTDSIDTVKIRAVGEVFESRSGKAAYYRAEMKALKAEHSYSYAVKTNGVMSDWYHFTTSNPEAKTFSFLFMGDVQDTINGITNRLLRQAIARHPEVEFVAFGGDLIERPMDKFYAETFRSIDSVCTAMPIVNITGNHDYLKYLKRKCERRFALTFPYFLKGMEERDDENHLFSFCYHNTQLFLLDSSRGFNYLYQQHSWLKEQLNCSKADHKIVMIHHPLYSVKKKNNNLIQRWIFNETIKDAGVKLVLQGHEHGYTHCTADEEPLKGYECHNPPLYTVSHCSPKNYNLKPAKRFHPVLNGRFYQIVRVESKVITMLGYNADTGACIDSVRIKI